MQQFILGMLVMASLIIGLFFLRFWRKSRDRLFAFFAGTFWLLGLNWLILIVYRWDEPTRGLYLVRLVAFLLLLIGIIDKNRAKNVG